MRFSSAVLSSTAASLAVSVPFSYPLANGFPNLNATALKQVENLAGGTIPNGPLPTTLKPAGIQTLQLIAANELFEVAYFNELLSNITNQIPGYWVENYDYVVDTITAVVNQEQLHALSANGVLTSAGQTTILPCKYNFPVSNFDDAIALAKTFTEVVLGVLPQAQATFAADGGDESALIPIVGSIIGQEGEQTGYYRALQKKVASSAPFLTGGAGQFAYTAINQFIVPGSCPNINAIGIAAFPALTVETTPKAQNSTQLFSVEGLVSASNTSVAYISGQILPVVVPISGVSYDQAQNKSFFFAPFPFAQGFARGLTIGALVQGANPSLNSSSAVAAATVAGPALIDVD